MLTSKAKFGGNWIASSGGNWVIGGNWIVKP
jgi:hypothetical protein